MIKSLEISENFLITIFNELTYFEKIKLGRGKLLREGQAGFLISLLEGSAWTAQE